MQTQQWIIVAGILLAPLNAPADVGKSAVLKVRGRGIEGRPAYGGGGTVKFLDATMGAQIVHHDGSGKIGLPLSVRYEVLETAPVLLTSRFGTEYWRLYSFNTEAMAAMYADEKIDLSEPGEHSAKATRAWFGDRYGPVPTSGLVGIRGHYYFLIDQPDGKWLDVTDSPPFFDQETIARNLTFTLANLSGFSVSIPDVQSTWKPRGPIRVRPVVTDADGKTLPVINIPLTAASGDWQAELTTEWGPLNEPTGWMRGELPAVVPEKITVTGTATAQTSDGLQKRHVAATFRRGDGSVSAQTMQIASQGYQLPRNESGTIRETRAVWVSASDIATAEGVDRLVTRCRDARLNTIVPSIFVRNRLVAKSDLMPAADAAEDRFDPLGDLIKKAHAAGLEVHPWFCVTYRDPSFRRWFREEYGDDIDMIDRNSKAIALGADVHRPAYRDFLVDLMVGVANDYAVDGIHLDYIRSMSQCFCRDCRAEFAKQFGKELTEATEDDWIAWQRQAIGDIVERTAKGVRLARPKAIMSAAVFSSMRGGAVQGQDPARWAGRGWLDIVMPMDYQMQTLQLRANERQFLEALDDDDRLVTGLSVYMRSGTEVMSRPPELLREQIELVRRMGIHGYCLFAHQHLSDELLELLSDELNRQPAVPYFRSYGLKRRERRRKAEAKDVDQQLYRSR